MGCVQSISRKGHGRKKKVDLGPTPEEEAAAARLLAAQLAEAARKAKEAEEPEPREEDQQKLARRDTLVLRQASAFDQLHEDALKDPSLRDLKVVVGENSSRLLARFEKREEEAKVRPELVTVQSGDIRASKLYGRLRTFEEKDEMVKLEPKLQKTFVQRERESGKFGEGESMEIQRQRSAVMSQSGVVSSQGSSVSIVGGEI